MTPLSDFLQLLRQYLNWFNYPATKWYFGVSCVVLAAISYAYYHARSNGWSLGRFVRYLFPRSIYGHRSTKQDFLYILSFPVIAGLVFKPALGFTTTVFTYQAVHGFLLRWPGDLSYSLPDTAFTLGAILAAFTLVSAMAADLGFYLHHYLLHKVGFLWEFHKVHHSAEVLTPLTDYRAHPIEILTYGAAQGIGLGIAQGIFNYLTGSQLGIYTILGLNAVMFVYYVMGYPLRHSHVWISYGPLLSRIFISPAQHQIHHSKAKKHWDKNLGGAFALWDWAFGTLYIPREVEHLEYGLEGDEQQEFASVSQLYLQPFKNNARRPLGLVLVALIVAVLLYYAVMQAVRTPGLGAILGS